MFPEVGASELVVIGLVALIVVGPKDLPVLLRKLGQWLAKIRGLAAEFKSSFSEMARQSELDDLRKEVEALRQNRFDPIGGALQKDFSAIRDSLNDVPKPGLHAWEEAQLGPLPDDYGVTPEPEAKPKRVSKPKAAPKPKAAAAPAPKAKAAPKAAAKPAASKPPAAKAAAAAPVVKKPVAKKTTAAKKTKP